MTYAQSLQKAAKPGWTRAVVVSRTRPITSAPWRTPQGERKAADRQPNILWAAPTNNRLHIGGAKYKAFPRGTPAPGDLYQVFMYSHLTESHDGTLRSHGPIDCRLIYPTQRDGGDVQDDKSWIRANSAGEVRLVLQAVPFPIPDDVLDERTWRDYLSVVSRRLCAEPAIAPARQPEFDQSALPIQNVGLP